MKKKLISITLALAVTLSAALVLGGCGDKEYPVSVANLTIEEEPESIVVLDPSAADIISFIGYDVKMVGRSDEVDQEWLSVVPTVGSAAEPDVDEIVASEASIVFATLDLSDDIKDELKASGIQVITMSQATTTDELETEYNNLGRILGGEITGLQKGEQAYQELLDDMDEVKSTVAASKSTDVLYTVCYIYTEDDELKMMTSGTYGDMLLGYTGAVNAAVNIDDNTLDVDTLEIANPNFIFYADEQTLENIKSEAILSKLTAVKNNKMLMVSSEQITRQGQTALDTLQKMVEFMYPELASSSSDDEADAAVEANATVAETTAAEETTEAAAEEVTSVAEDYGITVDDDLSLEKGDDNDNVKAVQQRLYDLGYVTDDENITGYYGDVTEAAVKQFQKNNDIKETGTADNATIVAMFNSDAAEAE